MSSKATPFPRSTARSTPIADGFLSARISQATRPQPAPMSHRSTSSRNLASTSSPPTSPLSPSSSTSMDSRGRVPPSAFRPASDAPLPLHSHRATSDKGKQRAPMMDSGREYAAEGGRRPSGSGRSRANWVVDVLEGQKGGDRWRDRERVILVLGKPSPSSLAPILHNPAFSETLLLVGSQTPSPSIEALTSPSFSRADQIFPTVQPFGPRSSADHPLLSMLEQATQLAQMFRQSHKSSRRATTPRRGSTDSTASLSPPDTPRTSRTRQLSTNSIELSEPNQTDRGRPQSLFNIRPSVSKNASETNVDSSSSRPSFRSRISSMPFGLNKLAEDKPSAAAGPTFDAVLHFIAPMSDYRPGHALKDMLQESVVVTTGVLPLISRHDALARKTPGQELAVPLLHVMPSQVPAPLPGVIENFLLSLMPSYSSGKVWGAVVSPTAWGAPHIDDAIGEQTHLSGAEMMLFGGVKCDVPYASDAKARAFLGSWDGCASVPGGLSISPPLPAKDALGSAPQPSSYSSMTTRSAPALAPAVELASPLSAILPNYTHQPSHPPAGPAPAPGAGSGRSASAAYHSYSLSRDGRRFSRSGLSNVTHASDLLLTPPTPEMQGLSLSDASLPLPQGALKGRDSGTSNSSCSSSAMDSSDASVPSPIGTGREGEGWDQPVPARLGERKSTKGLKGLLVKARLVKA